MKSGIAIFGASSDLGRGLVSHLNSSGIATICVVRRKIIPSLVLKFPHTNNFAQFPEGPDQLRRLIESFRGCKAIINCIGVPMSVPEVAACRRETFIGNFAIPALLASEIEQYGIPTLHMSSTVLEDRSSRLAESEKLLCSEAVEGLPRDTANLALKMPMVLDNLRDSEISNSYVFAKEMLEHFLHGCTWSKAIRISSFYGPIYIKPRLIPRLITHRLVGGHLALPDCFRNYVFQSDINRFVLMLIENFPQLVDKLVWCVGSQTKRVSEIYDEITSLLPACYGTAEFSPSVDNVPPQSPMKIGDYCAFPANEVPFSQGLRDTVSNWRKAVSHDFGSRNATVDKIGTGRVLDRGGSIAAKIVQGADERTKVIEKTASDAGFEGAGIPKLRAEAIFYQSLQAKSQFENLAKLYPRLLELSDSGSEILLKFEYLAAGRTLSDYMSALHQLPRKPFYEFVAKVFKAGYLTAIRPLSDRESQLSLSSFYLDRGIDRLVNFLNLPIPPAVSSSARAVIEAIRHGASVDICGVTCRNPVSALSEIRTSPQSFPELHPRCLGPCSHGDLTILNVLYEPLGDHFWLIDPREVVGDWDPIYDLSKLAFSISGFSLVIDGQISFERCANGFDFVVGRNAMSLEECSDECNSLVRWALKDPAFSELRCYESHMLSRIQFGEAIHYLADVPYRYALDRSYRDACTVLLLGTLKLEQALWKGNGAII